MAIAFDMLGYHSYHDDELLEIAFDDAVDGEIRFEEVRVASAAASVASRKKGCISILRCSFGLRGRSSYLVFCTVR